MKQDFLVDTDIFVDFLWGYDPAVKFIMENTARIVLSAISLAELYTQAQENKTNELEVLPDLFTVTPITEQTAHMAGIFKSKYRESHNLTMGDVLIAATAKQYHLELKTLRIECFPMIPGLKPPYNK
jgi:predicted nucleic acid-binding protein